MCYDYMAVFKFYFDKKFLADFKFTFGVYGFECIGVDLTQKEKPLEFTKGWIVRIKYFEEFVFPMKAYTKNRLFHL